MKLANNTLERTVSRRGRFVLAMDCVLAEAQWRWWSAAQLGRQTALETSARNKLVEAYIASCYWHLDKEGVLRERVAPEGPSRELDRLISDDPASAWSVISDIAKTDQSDEVLQRVANGALVLLLRSRGDKVFPEIEAAASNQAHVRELLSHIWDDHKLPPHLWSRIEALSEPGE